MMRKTSAVYERFFERVFKVFEVEMVRLARMTQGSIIKRGRFYTTATREAQALTKIQYLIDYEGYGISLTMVPNLVIDKAPCCIVKMDFVLDPQGKALTVSLDEVLERDDFSPFIFQDILSEELMLEVVECEMAILRKNQAHFRDLAQDPSTRALFIKKILKDHFQCIEHRETLNEEAIQAVLDFKLSHALTPFTKNFVLGNTEEALDSMKKMDQRFSDYDLRIIDKLSKNLKSGLRQCLVPVLTEKNYRYVSEGSRDIRRKQARLSYGLALLLSVLPMAILTYFVMGLTFWIFSFESFYTTEVNTLLAIPPLLIGNFFAAIWVRSLAHQMAFPLDHQIYLGYKMRSKHDKSERYIKWSSLVVMVMMLSVASWGGTNLLIFNQMNFSLAPGFMWFPPTKLITYYEVDHLEYRFELDDESGDKIIYQHYVLIFKDGKEVNLKPYISITECEDILIPFFERKNIKTIN
jgi:hypothetical protein